MGTDNIIPDLENGDYEELIDFITELEEYLYDWCQIYTGKYNYIDHSRWTHTFMLLMQKYKFDVSKIKEEIINGTVILPKYVNSNPKLVALEQQLYDNHKKKVKEFENKYLI